jgi:RimJ/RimL family protein N-acetyltransferase
LALYTGQLVRLGALLPEHFEELQMWEDDPDLQRLLDSEPIRPWTPARREDLYRHFQKDNRFPFAIFTIADDRLIGQCVLFRQDVRNRFGRMGIVIGAPRNRGRGYGTDALRILANYGFNELNLHRLEIEVFAFNEAAIRSYEKVGFKREVTKRQALYRDGTYHDVLIMGLLRQEWA